MHSHVRLGLHALWHLGTALAIVSNSGGAFAQEKYPSRPITMVVGFSAGGPSDGIARLTALNMAEALNGSIVVDNRAGAGGNIGSSSVARAKPDGYTIMLATIISHGWNSALYKNLGYDPIKDFAPVGMIASSPSTLIVPVNSPFKTVQQLIDFAIANPGKLNYGTGGVGSTQHLAAASFQKIAKIDITHVPYKGTAPASADLLSGQLDLIITTSATSIVNGGGVRALAVAAKKRLPSLPNVPTFDEAGLKGFYTDSWYGVMAPAGTPRPILEKLNAALAKSLRDPKVQQQFIEQGSAAATPIGVDAFWSFVKEQMPLAASQVRDSGATAQ